MNSAASGPTSPTLDTQAHTSPFGCAIRGSPDETESVCALAHTVTHTAGCLQLRCRGHSAEHREEHRQPAKHPSRTERGTTPCTQTPIAWGCAVARAKGQPAWQFILARRAYRNASWAS